MEILVGNSNDTSNPSNWNVLPGTNPSELQKLRQVGEPAYMAEKQREANELIARYPSRYIGLTMRRILNTWTGIWEFPPRWKMDESGLPNILMYSFISLLAFTGIVSAIRDRRDGVYPLSILVMVFPFIYYLTHSDMGFRHPIDPIMAIFLAYGMSFLLRKKRTFREERTTQEGIGESDHF